MKHKILILDSKDIRRLYPVSKAVSIVEKAFKDFALGKSGMPPKVYLDLPQYSGDFRAMPASISSPPLAGIKWVNSHSKNPQKNLPAVMGMMIVNSAKTALPVAIMDATILTAVRTAAAGGCAAKHLASKNAKKAAFIGCGIQAAYQLEALLSVRPRLKEISYFDPSAKAAAHFEAAAKKIFKGKMIRAKDIRSAAEGADIITTTTPSRKPLLTADMIGESVHINAIGADAPGKQELDPAILKKADILIDEWEQASHSGEINVPLHNGQIKKSDVAGNIGDFLCGKIKASADKITVFDSTGLAVQDLASAAWVIGEAKKKKAGKTITMEIGD